MKEYIKTLVREGLGGLIKEKSKTPQKDTTKEKTKAVEKNLDDRDQVSLQLGADADLAAPKSRIMKAAGLGNPNNASDRSQFNKKLDQKDGQGFTDAELAKVSPIIKNL